MKARLTSEFVEDFSVLRNRSVKIVKSKIDVDRLVVVPFLGTYWLAKSVRVKRASMAKRGNLKIKR